MSLLIGASSCLQGAAVDNMAEEWASGMGQASVELGQALAPLAVLNTETRLLGITLLSALTATPPLPISMALKFQQP